LFQLQGLKSIEVMNAKEISINDLKFLALQQGVSGERGFELWGPAKEGQMVYKAILAAGERFGVRQLGMRTKLVNHV
jgi:vanillate/3-O-methylgallate O-demethylase